MKKYLNPDLQKRNKLFQELRKSEATIISKLETLVAVGSSWLLTSKHYYLPLKQLSTSSKPIITPKDFQTIFSNVETILNFHRKLREGFDKVRESWPRVDDVGQVFLQLAPGLKAYGDYVANFDAAVNHLSFLREQTGEKGKLAQFLNEAFQQTNLNGFHVSLTELLTTPMHQISEYAARLEAMESRTPEDHPGLTALRSACSQMNSTSKVVAEALQESQNRVSVLQVQRRLADTDYNIIKPKRVLLGEYETKTANMGGKTGKVQKAHLVLFNDMLLICHPKSKDRYKVVDEVPLNVEISVQEIPSKSSTSTLEVTTPKQKFLLSFPSIEERKPFYENLNKVLEHYNNKVKGNILSFLLIQSVWIAI